MKTLFTGYFGAAKKYPEDKLQVRIASSGPAWWGAKKKSFQPNLVWRLFKAWKKGEWTGDGKADYMDQMDGLKKTGELQRVLDEIPDGSIMLCWETDVCTCHRGWLMEYLLKNEMAHVSEFPLPAKEKVEFSCKAAAGQTSLLL